MAEYPNLMVLVVDKVTRRVIDCAQIKYSWDLDEIVGRHDFRNVDLVMRQWSSTKPPVVEEVEEPVTDAPVADTTDEDIPF